MRKFKFSLLFFCLFVCFPFITLAYSTKTHAFITDVIVDFYNQNFQDFKITENLRNYLIEGSIKEDEPPRWMNHFYDPVYKRGLTYDPAIDPLNFGSWLSSKEWAKDEEKQISLFYKVGSLLATALNAVVGNKKDLDSETNFTWQKALRLYLNGDKEKAMFALGHIIHLIEDASVPDHTRNDPHIDGSPFESWTEKFNLSSPDMNLKKSLMGKSPIILNDLESYFDGLATYSNNNFFSKDTIGVQSGYSLPEPDLTNTIIKNSKYYILSKNYDGEEYPLFVKFSNLGSILGLKSLSFSIDDDFVMSSYWKLLAPQAVRYGAGVINLFFKEVERLSGNNNFKNTLSQISPQTFSANNESVTGLEVKNDFEEEKNKSQPLIYLNKAVLKAGESFVFNGINFTPSSAVEVFIENSSLNPEKKFSISSDKEGKINGILDIPADTKEGVYYIYARDLKTGILSSKVNYSVVEDIILATSTFIAATGNKNLESSEKNSLPVDKDKKNSKSPSCVFNENIMPSHVPLIISEVAWMGGSESYGLNSSDEWIELRNLSGGEINLGGYELLSKKGNIKIVFPNDLSIAGYGYLLLERTNDDSVPNVKADFIYSGAISNSDDGLQLFNPKCELLDEVVADPDWPAGDVSLRRTMERDSNLFWYTSGSFNGKVFGTPKAPNGSQYIYSQNTNTNYVYVNNTNSNNNATPDNEPQITSSLMINEIMYDYPGSDSGYEWVEVKNISEHTFNISSLRFFEGNVSHTLNKFLGDENLLPGEFLIITNGTSTFLSKYPEFKGKLFYSSFSLNNTGEEIALHYENKIFANVSYNSSLGAKGDGNSLQLLNGEWKSSLPTPGRENVFNQNSSNSSSQDARLKGWGSTSLVISEIQLGGADAGDEFIEIYNPTENEISLEGYSIQYISGSADEVSDKTVFKKNFEKGNVIKPHKFFLIGRGLNENREDGYRGNVSLDLSYRGFSLSESKNGGAVFLVSTTSLIKSFDDEFIVSSVFYGEGSIFEGRQTASIPPSYGSLVRKAYKDGYCISSLAEEEGEFLPKSCLVGNSKDEFEISEFSKPQNFQSLAEPREAPLKPEGRTEEGIVFYDYEKAKIDFKWKASLDAENSPSGIVYKIFSSENNGESILVATTSLLDFSYSIPEIGKKYKFILRAYDRDGMPSSPQILEVDTPFLNTFPIIYQNGVLTDTSYGSHYSDNWYELGRGFSGKLKSITLRGYVEDVKSPVNIVLEEFEDKNYTHKVNSFVLASGDIFDPYVKNVKIENLNIQLNPYSFYRLYTEDSFQNKSVILLGDKTKGRAMNSDFIYGTGRVENYYSFYPFILMEGEKGENVDITILQKPTKPHIIAVDFDKFNMILNLTWATSTDLDSVDKNIRYKINYTPFSDFKENEWLEVGDANTFSFPVVFPNKYKIGIRALDDDGLYSDTEILEWNFPENFSSYSISASYSLASQDFVLGKNLNLSELSIFVHSFYTISRPPAESNLCFLKLEDVENGEPILVATADNPQAGYYGCQGKVVFTFWNSLPSLVKGKNYRWTFYIQMPYDDLPKATVQFYGIDENRTGGYFSGLDFKNAAFEIKTTSGEIFNLENWNSMKNTLGDDNNILNGTSTGNVENLYEENEIKDSTTTKVEDINSGENEENTNNGSVTNTQNENISNDFENTPIVLEISAGKISPNVFTVFEGQEVVLIVKNFDQDKIHIFRFEDQSIVFGGGGISPAFGENSPSERIINFIAPPQGFYKFYCDVPDHTQEIGTMEVIKKM